jgi:hypothetical protein
LPGKNPTTVVISRQPAMNSSRQSIVGSTLNAK